MQPTVLDAHTFIELAIASLFPLLAYCIYWVTRTYRRVLYDTGSSIHVVWYGQFKRVEDYCTCRYVCASYIKPGARLWPIALCLDVVKKAGRDRDYEALADALRCFNPGLITRALMIMGYTDEIDDIVDQLQHLSKQKSCSEEDDKVMFGLYKVQAMRGWRSMQPRLYDPSVGIACAALDLLGIPYNGATGSLYSILSNAGIGFTSAGWICSCCVRQASIHLDTVCTNVPINYRVRDACFSKRYHGYMWEAGYLWLPVGIKTATSYYYYSSGWRDAEGKVVAVPIQLEHVIYVRVGGATV